MDYFSHTIAPDVTTHFYRLNPRASGIILAIFLVLSFPAEADDKLDCTAFFKPAESSEYPFTWRQNDRCEGFINQDVSYINVSVKISSFGYGKLTGSGPQKISNPGGHEIELLGSYLSNSKFYRLVAKIKPSQWIEWEYPRQLTEGSEMRLDRVGLLASIPGDREDVFTPYTISGSRDLYLGMVSQELLFNWVDIQLHDQEGNKICAYKHELRHLVNKFDQVIFKLDLCGQQLPSTARLSVRALLIIGNKIQNRSSRNDVIRIKQ